MPFVWSCLNDLFPIDLEKLENGGRSAPQSQDGLGNYCSRNYLSDWNIKSKNQSFILRSNKGIK